MVTFSHVIQGAEGLHARPVTVIAAVTKKWPACSVTVSCNGLTSGGGDLMGLMGLDARCGDTLEVTVEGPEEDAAAEALRAVFTF